MKKSLIFVSLVICSFVLGFSINSRAFSDTTNEYRVATVDIPSIIEGSSEMIALKTLQEKQLRDLQLNIDKANLEISKEQDKEKAVKLEQKYRKELNEKKISIDEAYNSRLTAIDNKIKAAVVEKARSMNYNVVLPKNVVLFGGDDITEQVSSIVN